MTKVNHIKQICVLSKNVRENHVTGINGKEVTRTLEYPFAHQLVCPPGELLETDPEWRTAKNQPLSGRGQ